MQGSLLIGRFIAIDSFYHRLHVLIKACVMLSGMMMVAGVHSVEEMLQCILILCICWVSAKLPLRLMLKQILLFKWLYIILFIMSPATGIFQCGKLMLFSLYGALFTHTSSPSQIATLFPSHTKISLQLQLSFRLIPLILDEVKRVYNAQVSRGLAFDELSLRESIKVIMAIIIPAIVTTVKRLQSLCDTLECRGYQLGKKRTVFYVSRFGLSEVLVLVVICYNMMIILL